MSDYVPGTTIPKPRAPFHGRENANTTVLIAKVSRALRAAGVDAGIISDFGTQAQATDYQGALALAEQYAYLE